MNCLGKMVFGVETFVFWRFRGLSLGKGEKTKVWPGEKTKVWLGMGIGLVDEKS
jgi:hypothetical protein